ncbi:MAG: glycosyltransferase [Marmoricola sp.]
MRIMVVTETFAPANDPGAETARHITDALLAAGHEVLLLTTGCGSSSYRGIRVERTRTMFSAATVRRAAADFGPDVAQFLGPRAMGAATMRALEGTGVPIVVLDPTPLHPRLGTVLASSEAHARVLAAAGIRATVWRAGVRTDEHHPGLRSEALHDRWGRVGTPAGPLTVVGYVGKVGQPTTKAVRRLARIAALPGVRLVVLGSGAGTPVLKEAGAKIIGETNGLEQARVIASLDLLVQPRKQDPRLSAVRKALASDVPVVAFATGAAAEVVRDGVTGLLVQRTKGPGGLLDAVSRLAGDAALRARLGDGARETVASRTWDHAVAELVEIYQPLVAAAWGLTGSPAAAGG